MEGRRKSIANLFWLINANTKHVRMKPAIAIAVPKCVLVVFRLGGEVGFDHNPVTKDGREDISDGQRLEVYVLWQALFEYCGKLFEQVIWSNLLQKGVPRVQLTRLEFTIRLKCAVRSSLVPSK
jgi:hypothetical protein